MEKSAVTRKVILGCLSLVILWVGIGGYRALVRQGKNQLPVKANSSDTKVKTITIEYARLSTNLTGYGTVRGKREVLLIPEVGGNIVSINPGFADGKMVKKGETLFTIDTREIKIRITQIEAELSRLKIQIDKTSQEAENIRQNLRIAAENVKLQEKELKRNETLSQKGMISEQLLDVARRNYLQELNSKTNYENQLKLIPIKIEELNAALSIEQAKLADAGLKLKKSTLKAPFNGIIYDKSVDLSQVVAAGQQVGRLVDVSILEIPVDLNVENIDHLSFERFKNATPWEYPCTIFGEGRRNSVKWKGYISRLEKINEASRTVRVVVEIPDSQSSNITLTKGMFCRVILPGKIYEQAISIPLSALRDNNTVYTLEKGKLQIKKLNLLKRLKEAVVIESGLSPGDKVITSALPDPVIGMRLTEYR